MPTTFFLSPVENIKFWHLDKISVKGMFGILENILAIFPGLN